MTCPRCGTENPAENQVCSNCGEALGELKDTQILPPSPEPGSEPGTPVPSVVGAGSVEDIGPPLDVAGMDRPRRPSELSAAITAGWGAVIGSAALTFLIVLLIGEGLAALLYAAGGEGSIADVVRIGGLFTYSFHRVGVNATFPGVAPEGALGTGEISLSFTIAISLLLGTFVLVWLLYRAGKSLGLRSGGPGWVRGLSGARLALPYAVLAGVGALILAAIPLSFDIPAIPGFTEGGTVELQPSIIAAFLWPLIIAGVTGFLGGFLSLPREGYQRSRGESLVIGGLRGGLAMAGWGVLFGFIGLQVLAFIHGDLAIPFNPEFLGEVGKQGAIQAVATVVIALMVAPNMGALALAPAMGSQLGVYGGGISFPLLSYFKFPTGFDPAALAGLSGLGVPGGGGELVQTEVAPAGYWLFLLVPLVATLLGGRLAARRANARSSGAGAAAGAAAGVIYAVLVTTLAVMAGVGFRVDSAFSGLSQSQAGLFGASITLTALVALAWGVVGGALGGLLGARGTSAEAVAPAGTAAGFGVGEVPPPPAPSHPEPDRPGEDRPSE